MKTTGFKILAAAALLMAGVAIGSLWIGETRAAETSPDKAEIEKIIKDWVMANPTVIMDSVDNYQRTTAKERSANAIKNNFDYLFKDDEAPFLGPKDGDVTIVEFFDFNCGYCKRAFSDLKALADSDPKVKIIFKDFPILGPSSETASKWALAAHKQGKYFEFHKTMMGRKGAITDAAIEDVAKEVGLDLVKAKTDIGSTDVLIALEKNRGLAGQVGVTGTPAFIIGEQLFPGALSTEEIRTHVEEERKKKKAGPK